MPNLSDKLRYSDSPLSAFLRGNPVFRTQIAPQPQNSATGANNAQNEAYKAEIAALKEQKVPLHKVLKGMDNLKLGEDLKDHAKQVYFGLTEPLTKVKNNGK